MAQGHSSSAAVAAQPSVSPELERRIERFIELFEKTRKRHRWTDASILERSALALAAARNRADEMEAEFERTSDVLKRDPAFFASLPGPTRFLLAAIVLATGEETKKALKELKRVQERLAELGFGARETAAIAGLILYLGSRGKAVGEESIRKAIALWEKLKERNWFQADREDLPMAALLTSSSWDVDTIDERVETIWQGLLRSKRKSGHALQLTAHVLTLSRLDEDVIVRRFTHLSDEMKKLGFKIGPDSYGDVALLALLPSDDASIVAGFERVNRAIRARKAFRPDAGATLAVTTGVLLAACLERGSLLGEALSLGLLHNAEVLFQSQAAAIVGFGAASLVAAS
jgi:hypothetical protein